MTDWKAYLKKNPAAKGTIDFEGRSEISLPKFGGWIYSKHPSTKILCLSYKLPGYSKPRRWHCAYPQYLIAESPLPEDLFAFILAGGLIEAHNAFFERCIWLNIMVARHDWPKIKHKQWRCSAAKASAASLPRDLDGAGAAMGLSIVKDKEGHRIMMKMCKPRKALKAEKEEMKAKGIDWRTVVLWHEKEEDIYKLWDYCDQDVMAEEALSDAVADLSEEELAVWQMDQAMNEKGMLFDLELATAALTMATEWKRRLNVELEAITGISAGTKRADVKEWLLKHEELDLPDTKGETVDYLVEHDEFLSGRAIRVLHILREVNRTSTRKWQSILDKADVDGRIRDLLMYHGAGTGRWSGKGVQIHNFPARDLIVTDFDEAAEDIKSGDIDWCIAMYGDIMKLLSHALRGAIISPPDRDLMVADYSAIEARCVLWLAGAEEALEVFIRGEDIYCDMATGIYGYKVMKAIHKMERQFGKQAILGLGYGMGFLTFLLTCRKYKIYFTRKDVIRIMGKDRLAKYEGWVKKYLLLDQPVAGPGNKTKDSAGKMQAANAHCRLRDAREDPKKITHELALMKFVVDTYRSRYGEVKKMWYAQEAAAIKAVQNIGTLVKCDKIGWLVENDFLYCILPSTRRLSYRSPEIKLVKTNWGEDKPALRYMSVNGVTRKWERTATYGGKLVENITQAVARDIMANAMMLADEGDIYDTVMSVHDELVCEVDENKGSLKEFEALMSAIPIWAHGCPITAEAERYKRYRK